MTPLDSMTTSDWPEVVERLGGQAYLEASARETCAFQRSRLIGDPLTLLRLVLAYCLGNGGLRLTAAWAASVGLVDISNVGLLFRIRKCEAWLSKLVARLLSCGVAPPTQGPMQGRTIRILDATTVPQAGRQAHTHNGLFRIHASLELPHERFSHFEVTDQKGGERLDRFEITPGVLYIADAGYLQPARIGTVLKAGADVLIRMAWRNGTWLDGRGKPFDFIAVFKKARRGLIDQPIHLRPAKGEPLALRFVAVRLPAEKREQARKRAERAAQQSRYGITPERLMAAEWVMLVTSLTTQQADTATVLNLYRLRWRVELAFKNLKSIVGLKGPPGTDPRSARVFILAHLLAALLLEPATDWFEDSPHWEQAIAA